MLAALPTDPEPSDFHLRHTLLVLRRRRWTILVITILLVTATLVATLLQTPMYRASAEIVFQPSAQNALSTTANTASIDPARDVQTQIEVMTSRPVRSLVATTLHLPNPPPVSATALVGTNAMVISITAADAPSTARVANAYANAYIQYKRTQIVNDLLDAAQLIQTRVSALQSQIDDLSAQIDAAPASQKPSVLANIGPQRDSLLAQQSLLKQKLDETQVSSALGAAGAQIAKPATVPPSPFSPKPFKQAVLALLLGLVIGSLAAFGREFLDDSVRSKEDAERVTHIHQTLGLIPTVEAWKEGRDALVVSITAPNSPPAEAYRSLRTTVQFLALDRSIQTILVTSAAAGEGKTTTLANLAISLARGGQRVCMLCCDLRRPRIHDFFEITK